jgi:hypothetical protein
MKLSEQARFELRVWIAMQSRNDLYLQYIYDEIKEWDIDDIELYKKILISNNINKVYVGLSRSEHDTIIRKMNFIKNGDKVRLNN